MKLSAVAALMIMSCAASQSSPVAPWRVELTSSGGLAGRGAGSYAITSEGEVSVTTMHGKSCTAKAAAEDLQRFEKLLAEAKPDTWQERYMPENPCCDRFQYTMTVDRAGARRSVTWVDDPPPMPADVTALAAAITGGPESLRVRYGDTCR